jgi:hypothetical protein
VPRLSGSVEFIYEVRNAHRTKCCHLPQFLFSHNDSQIQFRRYPHIKRSPLFRPQFPPRHPQTPPITMVRFHSQTRLRKADLLRQAQTPAQKRANARFAKSEEEKRGKPVSKKRDTERSPIPRWVIGTSLIAQAERIRMLLTNVMFKALLAFVVCGSLIFELIRLLFPPRTPKEYAS